MRNGGRLGTPQFECEDDAGGVTNSEPIHNGRPENPWASGLKSAIGVSMQELIDTAADHGVESIVIGMPHRGRLNVLGNVVRKPLRHIFSEFRAGIQPVQVDEGGYTGSGDVKYHLGTSYDRPTRSGKNIHLSLVANPSHLEAVAPVVIGKTRAKQYYSHDKDRVKHMAVLMHGDGSFSGQGVVYETFHLSDLPNYTTGGSVHIVVNNQVKHVTYSSPAPSQFGFLLLIQLINSSRHRNNLISSCLSSVGTIAPGS